MKCSLGIFNFLEEISRKTLEESFPFCCFPLFLFVDHWGRLSYLSLNSLELCIQMLISFLFSFAFHFSSFHSTLPGLLRQPFCFFAFLFLGDGLDSCLLYNVNCTLETTVLYRVLGNWDSSKWCAKLRNEQSCFYQKPQYSGKRQTSS